MKKLTIAVLSGGKSSERDVSLKGGTQVFEALDKQRYTVLRYDPRDDLSRLIADAPRIDAALIIMHGPYGEDGTIQGLLDLLNIPYQGSGVLGSALAMNKLSSKLLFEKAGIPIPPYTVVHKSEAVVPADISAQLGLPLVVKPVAGGSSIGMSIVQEERFLPDALKHAFEWDQAAIVETFIDGLELTASVIGAQHLTALPIVEIIPGKGYDFFNYEAKYTPGATQEICPARIDPVLADKAGQIGINAHRALFCRDYSRTDMILKGRDIYVLETNTIPGMTPTSLLPLAAQTAGISFSQLLDRLIELCLNRRLA
ncbi:MAG: D-alanine--D-alanine ligase family protein [Thermodesulfobacteriota bacterium]